MPKQTYRIVAFPNTRWGHVKVLAREAYERVLYALLLFPAIAMVARNEDFTLMVGAALISAVQLLMLAGLSALNRLRTFHLSVALSVHPIAEEAGSGQDSQIRSV